MVFAGDSLDYEKMEMRDIFRVLCESESLDFRKVSFPPCAQVFGEPSFHGGLLALVLAGTVRVIFFGEDGQRIEHVQEAGEALYLGRVIHYTAWGAPCVRIGISLSEDNLGISFDHTRSALHPPRSTCYHSQPLGTLHRELPTLFDLFDERAKYGREQTSDPITRALPRLIVEAVAERLAAPPEPGVRSKSEQLYQNIRQYVVYHFGREVNREIIAGQFRLSPDYISRLFMRHAGKSVTDYLMEVRMNRAREILASGRCSVAETAEACGFRDSAYFIKVFRRHWNVLPGKFKLTYQNASVRSSAPSPKFRK